MNTEYNDAWLSGFVGGEGCFALQVLRHSKNGRDTLIACFSVKLRKDDEEILQLLKNKLDCGQIRYRDAYGKTKPSVIYSVAKIADLRNKVIPFFEANPLLNKKHSDFLIFKEGIEFIYRIHQRTPQKTDKLRGTSKWRSDEWNFIKSVAEKLKQNRAF